MLNTTKWIMGVADPVVNLHNAATDNCPYVFVQIGESGAAVHLWSEDPADFRRVADALQEAARQLDAAIEGRLSNAVAGA